MKIGRQKPYREKRPKNERGYSVPRFYQKSLGIAWIRNLLTIIAFFE